jgi:predicted kinase
MWEFFRTHRSQLDQLSSRRAARGADLGSIRAAHGLRVKPIPPQVRLDAITAEAMLDADTAAAVGRAAATQHLRAERYAEHDGATLMRRVLGEIATRFAGAPGVFEAAACESLSTALMAAFRAHATQLEIRGVDGWIRRGADGIGADVLYDLALLVVNLLQRNQLAHANAVLNGWMERMRQYDALPLLPLLLSCRAALRAAHLAAVATPEEAQACLALAEQLHAPGTAAIVAIGGAFGVGKTTLAHRLAPQLGCAPGALVLRSGAARARLFGAGDERGRPAYDPSVARSVYRLLMREARDVSQAGYVAIVDAVFGSAEWRHEIESTADRAGVRFVGIWLDAPPEVLERRVPGERRGVVTPGADWAQLDASLDVDAVSAAALAVCQSPQEGV